MIRTRTPSRLLTLMIGLSTLTAIVPSASGIELPIPPFVPIEQAWLTDEINETIAFANEWMEGGGDAKTIADYVMLKITEIIQPCDLLTFSGTAKSLYLEDLGAGLSVRPDELLKGRLLSGPGIDSYSSEFYLQGEYRGDLRCIPLS